MRTPKHQIINAIVLACIMLSGCFSNTTAIDSELRQYIYPGGQHIEFIRRPNGMGVQIDYSMAMQYPPTTIIDFYGDIFMRNGFSPDRGMWKWPPSWEEFIDNAQGNNKYVRQYIASWKDVATSKSIILTIKYYRAPNEEWNSNMNCTLIIFDNL